MDAGLIIKYGRLVPGREQQAVELFTEATEFYTEQLQKGVITSFEPFLFATGDVYTEGGFWVIKGDREMLWKLVQDDRYLWLYTKAQFLVEHLQVEWLVAGEEIFDRVERATKVAAEFATVH